MLSEFEISFKKSSSQTTLKDLRHILEGFYKTLKLNDFFLNDLSRFGNLEVTSSGTDSSLLLSKTSETVCMLADYVVNKRSIQCRNRKSTFDILDRISSETRDVIFIVREGENSK